MFVSLFLSPEPNSVSASKKKAKVVCKHLVIHTSVIEFFFCLLSDVILNTDFLSVSFPVFNCVSPEERPELSFRQDRCGRQFPLDVIFRKTPLAKPRRVYPDAGSHYPDPLTRPVNRTPLNGHRYPEAVTRTHLLTSVHQVLSFQNVCTIFFL